MLGTYLLHVVNKQMPEVLKGEKDAREGTIRVFVNLLLNKLRSKGVDEEEEEEEEQAVVVENREGRRGIFCKTGQRISNVQSIVRVHKTYAGHDPTSNRLCA